MKLLAAAAVAVLFTLPAGSGIASAGGHVTSMSPELSISASDLESALTCTPNLETAEHDPVLLAPAFATDQQSFGWNYLQSLPAQGIPVCSLSLPDTGYGDLQKAAEYVVAAVRSMSVDSGRRVVMMGHQHGPLEEMWALKFWPDLPKLVSDFISIATPFHGTDSARDGCDEAQTCPPANWQIATGSKFLTALNSRPLPVGPSYTSIYTVFDELIYPQPAASTLVGARNVALQDVCPLRPVEHFSILGDNVAYRLVLDALTHEGPADPARISLLSCLRPSMPGAKVFPDSFVAGFGTFAGAVINSTVQSVETEPAVAAYAR